MTYVRRNPAKRLKTYRPTALALPRQKQHTFALIIDTVGAQVGAGQQTELYLPIDNECQADSVLFLSKKAEGAIDGIDGPESTGAATRVRAGVNRRKDSTTVRTVNRQFSSSESRSTHSSSDHVLPSAHAPSSARPLANPSLTSWMTLFLRPSFCLNSVVSSSPTILSSGKASKRCRDIRDWAAKSPTET